jgi:hypothetical protein
VRLDPISGVRAQAKRSGEHAQLKAA